MKHFSGPTRRRLEPSQAKFLRQLFSLLCSPRNIEARRKTKAEARRRAKKPHVVGVFGIEGAKPRDVRPGPRAFCFLVSDCQRQEIVDQHIDAMNAYLGRSSSLPPLIGFARDDSDFECTAMTSRPEARELLRHMNRGDHLVVHIADLGRSVTDFERQSKLLRGRGYVLHLLGDDGQAFVLDDSLDQATRDRLKEATLEAAKRKSRRIVEKLATLRQEGKPYSHRPPFGFCVLQMPSGPVLAACKHERLWAKRIVDWRAEGLTWRQVFDELKRSRAKTNQGTPWSWRRVRRFAELLNREWPSWLAA